MMTDEDLREQRRAKKSEEVGLRRRFRDWFERVCGALRRLCAGTGGRESLGALWFRR